MLDLEDKTVFTKHIKGFIILENCTLAKYWCASKTCVALFKIVVFPFGRIYLSHYNEKIVSFSFHFEILGIITLKLYVLIHDLLSEFLPVQNLLTQSTDLDFPVLIQFSSGQFTFFYIVHRFCHLHQLFSICSYVMFVFKCTVTFSLYSRSQKFRVADSFSIKFCSLYNL